MADNKKQEEKIDFGKQIDAYQYFQNRNEMLTDENIGRFLFIVNNDYSVRINKFINDLKTKQVKSKLKRSKSK